MAYATKKKLSDNSIVPLGSNLYGTCTSASGTVQKTVTMPDFNVLVSGVTIHVGFTNKNTASNPTLKVGGTNAIAIKRNGSLEGVWEDGSVISFTYDGTNWVQNDSDDSGKTYGLSYDSSTNTISIVEDGGTSSIMIDDDDTTYTISISGHTLTLTPSNGTAQTVTLPDNNTTYTLSKSGSTIVLTGSDGSTSSVTDSDTVLKYTEDAPDGTTTNNVVQNDVANNVASGGYSLAEGIGTTASGLYSHAEGQGTTASGDRSHAEGNGSTASGNSSRAEGNGTIALGNHSHAEGNASVASGSGSHAEGSHTEASRDVAHAEGFYTVASGIRSFAGNNRTIAQRADQTVIGRMNIADTQGDSGGELGKYAFIIGNGNADDDRSNGFTVDWLGRVGCGDYSGAFKSIFDIFYPVGSYYETSDTSFNPNDVWGGTWYLEAEGVVHVSGGSNYSVLSQYTDVVNADDTVGQKQGGDESVTLDTTQIPAHTHGSKTLTGTFRAYQYKSWNSNTTGIVSQAANGNNNTPPSNGTNNGGATFTITATHEHSSVGGGQAHNNMQPYIVVNRWHRTA